MSFKRSGQPLKPLALTPIVWALGLTFGAAAVQAQSLSAIYEAARAYDPTYLGVRAQTDSVMYRYEQVKALNRPSVNLVVSGTRAHDGTPYTSPTSTDSTVIGGTVSAQQSLFNRANDLSIDQAAKALDSAKAALVLADEDLIVRITTAYFDVLTSTDALATVQANERAIAEQLASAKRNFDVGNATITDTREAQARSDLAVAQEVAARNDLDVKKVTLDQLVGRVGVIPQPLAVPVVLPPVLPSQPEDWVRLAMADNPGLKQSQYALDVAQLETGRARAGHLPTLSLGASYAKSHTSVDAHGVLTTSGVGSVNETGTGTTTGIALTLNVPIFAGYAIQNRVKETLLLEQKAQTDLDGVKNAVTVGTRTAFLVAASGGAQVKALEAAETSSKLALESTQLGYKVGVKVNLDVLNSQSQLFQTERDLSKARYDFLLATLKLRQAAGHLTSDDLAAVNALLAK